jgi:hypothetical protein
VRVGSIELDAVVDAWGELGELAELYPDVPESAWEPYRALYPELFADSRWRLPSTLLPDPRGWSCGPRRHGHRAAGTLELAAGA